ncbi:Nif3-like dinuclear metal center hexameric protein [Methanothermococcus okinawensis]|uniref:NGG1p interacting factor 3 protein, NIF3 n=1 Tax=Methanothermococcus okinawensis (strain DSM 14208 / JCM 11175 / IH1) TaxID=647113 RepID=F8ANZ0_METOI|nr:Nif3-like dinuclear metal center hexameric protein [Methanothermococcus okinawensis]AEH07133.1 NGG1p interacting factor 3 protein, NIF3 [Methanothermococcus okinawensis IH1]
MHIKDVKSKDIIKFIETFAPPELAIEGDNIGLQVGGNLNRDIEKIGIALDPSLSVVKKAKNKGVDFLFTHHPILKDPIRTFTGVMYEKLKILMENEIILYSAHTNLDICKNGLNDALADLYHLKDVKYLYDNGLGRLGIFNGTFEDILNITKEYITKNPTVVNAEIVNNKNNNSKNNNKKDLKVAILSGYGLSQKSINYVSKFADVYISGDLTHHSKILAEELGLCVIDGGHYGTEVYGLKLFKKYIEDYLNVELISLDF